MNYNHSNTETFNDTNTLEQPLNRLYLLDNLDDWKVQDGDTDIRGWNLYAGNDKIGEIESLIVNPRFKKALYAGVRLDDAINSYRTTDGSIYYSDDFKSYYGTDQDRYVIVPIGMLSIDKDNKKVWSSKNLNAAHFANSPRFNRLENGGIEPIHELMVVRYYTDHDDVYSSTYDDNRFDINTFKNKGYITDEGFYTSDLFSRRRYFDRYTNYSPSMTGFKTGMRRR